ncbi:unnamed protein product [Jaminaea pallidilutea]
MKGKTTPQDDTQAASSSPTAPAYSDDSADQGRMQPLPHRDPPDSDQYVTVADPEHQMHHGIASQQGGRGYVQEIDPSPSRRARRRFLVALAWATLLWLFLTLVSGGITEMALHDRERARQRQKHREQQGQDGRGWMNVTDIV